ncbi:glycosyltransferase [Rothia nasimurium]|uniref:glycosyltransferase n=1 Tax=Rothia nasimurium TaxID=85336 RepID=UPI001F223AC3|nr:glycosyltransferase [Rothia nasimurium]
MHIVIVDPSPIYEEGGWCFLPERSYLGYLAYKKYLSAHFSDVRYSVVSLYGVVKSSGRGDLSNLKKFSPSDINLKKISAHDFLENLEETAVVLSLLKPDSYTLANFRHKLVYLVEFTPSIRRDIQFAMPGLNFFNRIRICLGLLRQYVKEVKIIKRSAGVQFNGPAAASRYSKFNENSITFFDHRVSKIPERSTLVEKRRGGFSVAFSGRLSAMKGAGFLADISCKLYEINPSIKFYVMGEGEKREEILRNSAPNLIYKGFMEYKEGWEPFVRENIDLMIFPHPQGDPSMTYYESLGQGIPILSFSNETSDYLADQGLGWTVPRGDIQKLVNEIARLACNPREVMDRSSAAVDFMSSILYDQTVARRMNHLIAIAREAKI